MHEQINDLDIELDIDYPEAEEVSQEDISLKQQDVMIPIFERLSIDNLFEKHWHIGDRSYRRGRYMAPYIFDTKAGTDIIDLGKTIFLFKKALNAVRKCVAKGEKVLFVGTESHTSELVKAHAERCAQYSIHRRWLGGLLTNWNNTFSNSIAEMKKLEKQIDEGYIKNFTKREQITFIRKRDRFLKFLDSVKDIGSLPGMVVVTSYREKNAIREAQILGIPVILLMDTPATPEKVTFPVPGNDRSIKVTEMFCQLIGDACLLGLKDEMNRAAARQPKVNPA